MPSLQQIQHALIAGPKEVLRSATKDQLDSLLATVGQYAHRVMVSGLGWPASRSSEVNRVQAALMIMAATPTDPKTQKLVDAFTHFELDGSVNSSKYPGVSGIELHGIEVLQKLVSLTIKNANPMGSLAALAKLGSLRALTLFNVSFDEGVELGPQTIPNIETLKLERLHSRDKIDLSALGRSTSLKHFEIVYSHPVQGLAETLTSWTQLRFLKIHYSIQVATLDFAKTMPELEHLELHSTGSGLDIKGIQGLGHLKHLELEVGTAVSDPSPVDGLPELAFLKLHLDQNVSNLNWKRSPPKLEEVRLDHCAGLKNLAGLAGCGKLRKVDASYTQISDVTALAGKQSLEYLQFTKCPLVDLHALSDLPKLKLLQLSGTKMTRTKVPEALHAAVQPPSLVAQRKTSTKKSAAAKPKVHHGKTGERVARIRRMLLSRDHDKIDQALELLSALDDPAVFEGLIGGVKWEGFQSKELGDWPTPNAFGKFIPNRVFEHGSIVQTWRQHALRGVVALAPAGGPMESLRSEVRRMLLSGSGSKRSRHPVDLARLDQYPKLKALQVTNASEIRNTEVLTKLSALKWLSITNSNLSSGHPPLAFSSSLDEVRYEGDWRSPWSPVGKGEGWGDVRTVRLNNIPVGKGEGFGRMKKLEVLHLYDPNLGDEGLQHFGKLSELKSLTISCGTNLHEVSVLADCAKLTRLSLASTQIVDVAKLERLKSVEHLILSRAECEDLAPLLKLDRLKELQLGWIDTNKVDVSPLADHPSLESVDYYNMTGDRVAAAQAALARFKRNS